MHDLTPLTALGTAAPFAQTIGALTLTERPNFALASIAARRGGQQETSAAVAKITGAVAPGPGQSAGAGGVIAIWTAPGQWLVEAPYATHEFLMDELRVASEGAASITEQTGGWARFDLTGKTAFDVLERLCPLDSRNMANAAATRTTIDHITCIVIRREAGHVFTLWCPRSSAGSLIHGVTTAMTSIA